MIHCWVKEAAQKTKSSKCLSRSNRIVSDKANMDSQKSKDLHSSRKSRASRDIRSSKSSIERKIEKIMKVVELIVEAELLRQKQKIKNKAEKLKIKKN